MHLRVVGGLQPVAGRGQLRDPPPAQPPSVALVMGLPDLPQRLNHWGGAGRRRGRRLQGVEQPEPVRADLKGERLTLLPALGQGVLLDPARVALKPGGRRNRAQPIRGDSGQVVEGGAQRLAYQLKEMQVAHGAQHVCAESRAACPVP